MSRTPCPPCTHIFVGLARLHTHFVFLCLSLLCFRRVRTMEMNLNCNYQGLKRVSVCQCVCVLRGCTLIHTQSHSLAHTILISPSTRNIWNLIKIPQARQPKLATIIRPGQTRQARQAGEILRAEFVKTWFFNELHENVFTRFLSHLAHNTHNIT